MTKTILIIVIATTLILGIFTLGNTASAVISENPALQSKILTEWGPVICTTEEGALCVGEARTKFLLIVTGSTEEGTVIGDAEGKIKLRITVKNPGDVTLTNVGLLSFEYDSEKRVLLMSGKFIDKKGNPYEFDATGVVGEFEKRAAPIDLTVKLVEENETQIDFTSAGIMIGVGY